MQKDDIIIRKAILHILDYQKGHLGLSGSLLELGPDRNDFIRNHIYKLISSDDMKTCRFHEENSPVFSMLESFDEGNEEEYIQVSQKIGELIFEVMCESGQIPSADLVMASFQVESTVRLALLKMNYKENFTHDCRGENQNDMVIQRNILPSGTSKLGEAAIIDLTTMEIRLAEKKYEINGEKVNYLSEKVLFCHGGLPAKKKFGILTKTIQDINNKYDDKDINSKMEAKSILSREFTENQEFNVNEIGDKIFGSHEQMKQDFDEVLERYDMQYDTFTVANESTVKKLEKQTLMTDTGIEITIPMEEYDSKSNVEVIEEPGGVKTVIIKNIENLILK